MKGLALLTLALVGSVLVAPAIAQESSMKNMDMPTKHEKATQPATLAPAEGASIKIISPKANQVISGDKVPLQFKLTKGKRGEHVHAYVDGELIGMFKSNRGTLNGIKPGFHTLELRVATADHNTELDAVDKISFTVK